MSDTPRTDKFEELGFHEQPINWWDFARKLERELADNDKEIARLKIEKKDWISSHEILFKLLTQYSPIIGAETQEEKQ